MTALSSGAAIFAGAGINKQFALTSAGGELPCVVCFASCVDVACAPDDYRAGGLRAGRWRRSSISRSTRRSAATRSIPRTCSASPTRRTPIPTRKATATSSDADLFARQLQSRLLSALSSQITDAIFGANPQERGTITFGGQTISFVRTLESVQLAITNNDSGRGHQHRDPDLREGELSDAGGRILARWPLLAQRRCARRLRLYAGAAVACRPQPVYPKKTDIQTRAEPDPAAEPAGRGRGLWLFRPDRPVQAVRHDADAVARGDAGRRDRSSSRRCRMPATANGSPSSSASSCATCSTSGRSSARCASAISARPTSTRRRCRPCCSPACCSRAGSSATTPTR